MDGNGDRVGPVTQRMREDFAAAARRFGFRRLSQMSGQAAGRLWGQVVDAEDTYRRDVEAEKRDFKVSYQARVATRVQELQRTDFSYQRVLEMHNQTGRRKTHQQLEFQAERDVYRASREVERKLAATRDAALAAIDREARELGLLPDKAKRDFNRSAKRDREGQEPERKRGPTR